jgi:hypothetical protein
MKVYVYKWYGPDNEVILSTQDYGKETYTEYGSKYELVNTIEMPVNVGFQLSIDSDTDVSTEIDNLGFDMPKEDECHI